MTAPDRSPASAGDVDVRSAAEMLRLACGVTDSEARAAFYALDWSEPKLGRTPPKKICRNYVFPNGNQDWPALAARGLAQPEPGNPMYMQLTELGIAVMRLAWHARAVR